MDVDIDFSLKFEFFNYYLLIVYMVCGVREECYRGV